jgi:segregation and condensation protein A
MSSTNYTVQLDNFSGPLDLLLNLIKKNKLDICDVNIAKITEDYLSYVNNIELSQHDANRFLEIAVKLILTKSQVLLPDYKYSDEDTNLEDLSDRLIALEIYKNIAKKLEKMQSNYFITRPNKVLPNDGIEYSNLNIASIVNSYNQTMASNVNTREANIYTAKRKFNTKKRQELIKKLLELHKFSVLDITTITNNNKDSIMMFMIILEFIKSKKLRVTNSKLLEVESHNA